MDLPETVEPDISSDEVVEDKEEESKDEAQAKGFSNSITDLFDLHREEGDNNYKFHALPIINFRSPDYHAEVTVQVVDYMTAKSERFSAGQNDIEGYLILLCDYQSWGGQKQFQAFAEL